MHLEKNHQTGNRNSPQAPNPDEIVAVKRRCIQQQSEDYSSLHSWSPYSWAQSNCWTFALDKTKSETNERPLRFNSEYCCLIILPLILCLWKTVHWRKANKERDAFYPSKNRSKNWMVVFRGEWPDRFRTFKRATLGITWNTEKYPKTPDGIILQTKALGLSLHHCRGKWDNHNCYHLFNPPSKSRSALQIKYLECLCSFSCIIVHHYSLGESHRWVRPKTPMCSTQRKWSKKIRLAS